ncbi:Cwh43p [Rhodotorula paludigena]|uniref:Cwh43p n=1 Tax=Rhodotorula paludigena TaxID=86838 RepID=UPI00317AB543
MDQGPVQPAHRPQPALFAAHAAWIAKLHTALSAGAFAAALALGLALHYQRIVKNQYYGYPKEWFPSVSATIGDWFPERNVFQILIALTSGPRFLLILLALVSHRQRYPASALPGVLAFIAAVRTVSCGGWVFITSSDHGDAHDIFMVLYIVLNLPYMILHTIFTPAKTTSKTLRRVLGTSFFATLFPLVYFYIQHKQKRIAGAYSVYALFEWLLIILDVSFDSIFILDYSPPSNALPPLELAVAPASSHFRANAAGAGFLDERAQRPPGWLGAAVVKLDRATASARHFAADCYLSFCYWTLLVALGPMIFYSSVWAMGLSGDEIALLCTLAPFLLAVPPLRRAFAHPVLAHCGLLAGLATRWIDDGGKWRLRWTAVGLGCATMGRVAMWWDVRRDAQKLEARSMTFLVGLVLSVLVKFANHSINPLWPFVRASSNPKLDNGGWNGFGLTLAVIAFLDATLRRKTATVAAPESAVDEPRTTFLGKIGATVGFGSLFFLVHWLFTDSGTTIAWSFEGYPTTGPFAFPHGLITIAALCVGLLVAPSQRLAHSFPAYLAACASAALLYLATSWLAFLPACYLGIYSLSLFPPFASSLLAHTPRGPGLAFGTALLVYCLFELASTWTVAYAFVPAGFLLRERTDLVLALVLTGVGAGLGPLWSRRTSTSTPYSAAAAAAAGPASAGANRALRRHVLSTTALVSLLGTLVVLYRGPAHWAPPAPAKAQDRVVTAAIWTVHFGEDGRMWESQRRMAGLVQEAEIDVIGLLETDNHRVVGGNRDITQFISHSLNMPYVDLGPGPQKNTWGAALISKFPILRSSHHLLPSPHGELAPAIYATLDVYGTEVDVVVAHNGQEEDPLDRELQSRELARMLAQSWPRPAIFLGYLVTKPHAPKPAPYRFLVEDGKMLDISPSDHDRWCQYIFYRGVHRVGYARLNRGSQPAVTDSEVQVGRFIIPLPNATASRFTTAALAVPPGDALNALPPIPLDAYVAHLHASAAPLDQDWTIPAPERYLPREVHFPAHLYGKDEQHRFIVLKDERGGFAPHYFMRAQEREWAVRTELRAIRGEKTP